MPSKWDLMMEPKKVQQFSRDFHIQMSRIGRRSMVQRQRDGSDGSLRVLVQLILDLTAIGVVVSFVALSRVSMASPLGFLKFSMVLVLNLW
jgi:hypothetical protein